MKTWDIFCRVIDNFGDVGVCWRLARQLAADHHQKVRLWVDDVDSLTRIWPATLPLDKQLIAGVEVCRWEPDFRPDVEVADVVIEAFACDIPETYIKSMAVLKAKGQMPVWINLEYLSAEGWIEDCHRMTSTHPATGLRKSFFFPGFNFRTGGLLREKSLLTERDQFRASSWLAQLGVTPKAGALLISLFAYENEATPTLLATWASSKQQVHCLIPAGKILTSINQAIGKKLAVGNIHQLGSLCLQVIPFITQTDYDRLLWACDINFVRGEDSFVRAQWAAKPLVWHIYPQDEDAHITKLNAFLDICLAHSISKDLDIPAPAIRTLWLAWNQNGDLQQSWETLVNHLNQWQQHSRNWCDSLAIQPDLAHQLVDFCTHNRS